MRTMGIATGLDVNAIIEKLMKLDRQPIIQNNLLIKQTQDKMGYWRNLATRLKALEQSAFDMFLPGTFKALRAVSSATDIVKADITGAAQKGKMCIRDSAYTGDEGVRRLEISPFQEVVLNLDGVEAFGGTAIFDDVQEIINRLLADDADYLGNQGLMDIDSGINDFLDGISTVGARIKRVEIMKNALMTENIHLREMRSGVEDIDLALTITEYMMQENVHYAALSTGARTMQPTLIDYLR